ncbi:condensation domain-containing protein, partial [Marinicrinis sediminis]
MNNKREVKGIHALSPMQEGMLFHALKEPDSSAYFEQFACTLKGTLHIDKLQKCLNLLIAKYDILRTNFYHEQLKSPKQIVFKEKQLHIQVEDWSDLSEEAFQSGLNAFMEQDQQTGFDLAKDMLMRVTILIYGEKQYRLIWSYHHIVMDGWCLRRIVQEIMQLYEQLIEENQADPGFARPYSDYIKWLEQQDKQEAMAYWSEYLSGYEGYGGIPGKEQGRLAKPQTDHREQRFVIPSEIADRLEKLARTHQTTLNVVMQAAWGLLLSTYNQTNDVVFGMVSTGRPAEIEGVEQMIGLFINTIPLRIRTEDQDTVGQLLDKVQQSLMESQQYDYVPLAHIQAQSAPKRTLIDHIVTFQNFSQEEATPEHSPKLGFEILDEADYEQTHYDFTLMIMPNQGLDILVKYNSASLHEASVERMARHYMHVLETISSCSHERLDQLHFLTEQERREIVHVFNESGKRDAERTGGAWNRTIPELFAEQVALYPDELALVEANRHLTYRQLDAKAERLAQQLRD